MTQNRTRIKVCGMTQVGDVQAAVGMGVDAIGMILHADSPRTINLEAAQKIRAVVPAFVALVGVFVNADIELVSHYKDAIGLDLIQLHGDESPDYMRQLNAPFLRAIRAKNQQQVVQQAADFPSARAVLLDPYVKGKHGGTGTVLNDSAWPRSGVDAPLILAGGLSPENVYDRVMALQPFAVDINSGVEESPGVKSHSRLREAINEVKRADSELAAHVV